MKLTGTATIVTYVLLAIALKSLVVTSVTTSYVKLQQLLNKGDQALIQSIEAEIKEQTELVRKLTTVLTQYSKTQKKDFKVQADHPNDYYLLVKHHIINWYYSNINQSLFPVVMDVIKNQNISFPAPDDAEDAALALVRLQFVYRLKVQDMYDGNYLGYMGSPLEMEDAYLLGSKAFMAGYLPPCIEWLQLSADLLTKAIEDQTKDASEGEQQKKSSKNLQSDYILTLALLGRAHLYLNDTKKARELYTQCEASGLTDVEDADELLRELESENITKLQEDYKPSVLDTDDNVTELCSRGKEQRVSALRPYHMCRYKSNVFIPYQRFREEILSTSPYASLLYDVIYDEEIERLKLIVKEKGMYRGQTTGEEGGPKVSDNRTGELEWVDDSQHPLVARVSQRVKAFTGLDVTVDKKLMLSSAEKFQVVNYGMGGHYGIHVDKTEFWNYQDRLATVLFYLTEVEKGGATIFPKVGISVTPVKGMALLWYTFPPHLNKRDGDTLHAACPVIIGNKWVANKWIWINGNTFRRPCGPSPDSQQLDVEKIVTVDALKKQIIK